jgi:hypothetical protein
VFTAATWLTLSGSAASSASRSCAKFIAFTSARFAHVLYLGTTWRRDTQLSGVGRQCRDRAHSLGDIDTGASGRTRCIESLLTP